MLCDDTTRFTTRAGAVAEIDADGILRFKVDATDENAIRFIQAIEDVLGRRLTGISAVAEGENQANE